MPTARSSAPLTSSFSSPRSSSSIVIHRLCRGDTGASPVHEALLPKPPPFRTTSRYAVELGASAVLLALAFFLLPSTPWRAVESAFLAAHFVAHTIAAWSVASEKGVTAATQPLHIRVFWITTALGATLFSASVVVRCADDSLLFPDDPLTFAGLLVSMPLAYLAITGFTGHDAEAYESEPENTSAEAPATPCAAASFLSLATFSWINPFISKGYANDSLTTDDVPPVSPGNRAEASYALFTSNWPVLGSRHSVGVALWLSFWPQLLLTAALGLLRLAAMYVSLSLIDQFVEFIRRGGTTWEILNEFP